MPGPINVTCVVSDYSTEQGSAGGDGRDAPNGGGERGSMGGYWFSL